MKTNIKEFLSNISELSHLSHREMLQFARNAEIVKMPAGKIVYPVGLAKTDEIFFLLEGQVKISKVMNNGKELIVNFLSPGSLLGIVGLVSGMPRKTSVTTTRRSTLLKFDGSFFHSHIQSSASLSYRLLCLLACRLENTSQHFIELATLSLDSRLHARLTDLAQKYPNEPDYLLVRDRPSHKDLADLLGCTREAISRSMKKLERVGLIHVSDESIFIPRITSKVKMK